MGDKGELEKELRRLRWQLLSGACLSLLGVMYLINWADPDLATARLLGPASRSSASSSWCQRSAGGSIYAASSKTLTRTGTGEPDSLQPPTSATDAATHTTE